MYSVVNGCHTEVLNLTITPSTSNITTIAACGSYTWPLNNQVYTTSGIYSVTQGCYTEILDVSITPNTSNTTKITACGSYTWLVNDMEYTSSGVYSVIEGCNAEILELTIIPSTSNTYTVSACESYLWPVNGQTYTNSDTYTFQNGCDESILNLTINAPIIIGTQPVSNVLCNTLGSTVNFTVAIAQEQNVMYQWQYSSDNGTNWNEISTENAAEVYTNFNTSTLTVTRQQDLPLNGTIYRVVISDGVCTATSNEVIIGVYGLTATTVSGGTTICAGENSTTLTIAAGSVGDIQWKYWDGVNAVWVNYGNVIPATLLGAINPENSIIITNLMQSTWFKAVFSNGFCSNIQTSIVKIIVNPLAVGGSITGGNIVLCGSTNATNLSLIGSFGSRLWQKSTNYDSSNPNNATWTSAASSALTLTVNNLNVSTWYRVKLSSNSCNTVYTDPVYLFVFPTVKAGTISAPAATVCLGSDITLTLGGYAATAIQWQSSPISTTAAPGVFTDIPGATGAYYTIVGTTSTMDKSYRVVVTNSCNNTTATSLVKTLKVDPTSVAGDIVSGGGVVCSGSGSTLKVAGNVGTVQWEYSTDGVTYVNAPAASAGQTIPFGTTSTSSKTATYIITGITTELYFRAKSTSGTCSSAYTAAAHYTLGTLAVAGSVSPESVTLCPGTGTTLTLSSSVGVVTWQKSTNVTAPVWASTTNHTMSLSTGNLTASAAYRALVTIGTCSTVYSNIVVVTVTAKPVVKALTTNTTSPTGAGTATAICTNSAVAKILTAGVGTTGGTIQWQWSTTSATAGFVDIAGENGTSYTITNPAVGANYYRIVVTNSCAVSVVGAAKAVYYKDCGPAKFAPLNAASPFSVVAYPNPYSENFNLSLTTSSVDTVGVSIYDMTGKLIDRRDLSPSEVSGLQIGNRYASGVYNVVVTQGSEVKTLRVIKR